MFFEANHRGPAYQTGLALRFQKLPVDLKFHEVILRRRFGIMIKVSQLSLCAVTRRPRSFMPHSQGITYQLPTKLNTTFHRFHPTNSHLHHKTDTHTKPRASGRHIAAMLSERELQISPIVPESVVHNTKVHSLNPNLS
jgi:hypothetical protein